MRKLLTGLGFAASMALLATAAQAECFHGHDVTASVPSEPEVVAMSTTESQPPIVEEQADSAAASECPEGATDCPPADQQ